MNDRTKTASTVAMALAIALAGMTAGMMGCEDRRADDTPPMDQNAGTRTSDNGANSSSPSTTTPPARRTEPVTPPNVNPTEPSPAPGGTVPPTPTQPSAAAKDQAVTEEIRAMIRNDSTMSAAAEGIEVVTRSGVVTLTGNVPTQAEKDTIEARAAQVSGVVRVVNGLEVQP